MRSTKSSLEQRLMPIGIAIVALLVPGMFAAPTLTHAMPNIAVATGLKCSACHTLVPQLNAFGRYVQETGYSAITRETLDKAVPIWLDEAMNYDSTAGAGTGVPRYDFGNFGIHADGYAIPDVTYHVQQWLVQSNQSGGLDTAWVAYNHVLSPNAHLFFGKIEVPSPSTYSQTTDLDPPTASSTLVGEHDWGATITNNRWGSKFVYAQKGFEAEAGYVLSSDDLNGITDFTPGDKTFMWKAAYAQPKSPLEIGLFGTDGSVPVSTGLDRYNSVAPYVELDPSAHGRPGLQLYYQSEHDSNPGAAPSGLAYPAIGTRGYSAEINELLFKGNLLLAARHDFNDASIAGGIGNGNAFNASFNLPWAFLHGYIETTTGSNSELFGVTNGPTWKGMLWLTLPVSKQL